MRSRSAVGTLSGMSERVVSVEIGGMFGKSAVRSTGGTTSNDTLLASGNSLNPWQTGQSHRKSQTRRLTGQESSDGVPRTLKILQARPMDPRDASKSDSRFQT